MSDVTFMEPVGIRKNQTNQKISKPIKRAGLPQSTIQPADRIHDCRRMVRLNELICHAHSLLYSATHYSHHNYIVNRARFRSKSIRCVRIASPLPHPLTDHVPDPRQAPDLLLRSQHFPMQSLIKMDVVSSTKRCN